MQKRLEFVISRKFLVVRLQQNKVYCFLPYFHFVRKYQVVNPLLCYALDSAYKVLTIPSTEKTFILSIVFYLRTWRH